MSVFIRSSPVHLPAVNSSPESVADRIVIAQCTALHGGRERSYISNWSPRATADGNRGKADHYEPYSQPDPEMSGISMSGCGNRDLRPISRRDVDKTMAPPVQVHFEQCVR